jgi:uncharacterized RDD family membrane protein YckC
MNEDVYQPPKSELKVDSIEGPMFASRWSRLGASLLDGLSIACITLPTMYFTGGFDDIAAGAQPSVAYSLTVAFVGIVAFFLINFNFLLKSGQTLGKKAVGIKIVTKEGLLPSISDLILKRYSVYFLPGQVPIAGQLFSIINILFIFGKQRRCIHDYAAGTMVVIS